MIIKEDAMESDRVEIAVNIRDVDKIKPIQSAIRAFFGTVPDTRWWMDAVSVIERQGTEFGTISVTAAFDLFWRELEQIKEVDFPALVATIRAANGDADCTVWMDIASIPWFTLVSDDDGFADDDDDDDDFADSDGEAVIGEEWSEVRN
jgi:hypothetical protein